jgi:hypothetical protein
MSTHITIPRAAEIRERIRACRDELAQLKRLLRAAAAVEGAEEARLRRQEVPRARQPQP